MDQDPPVKRAMSEVLAVCPSGILIAGAPASTDAASIARLCCWKARSAIEPVSADRFRFRVTSMHVRSWKALIVGRRSRVPIRPASLAREGHLCLDPDAVAGGGAELGNFGPSAEKNEIVKGFAALVGGVEP